MSEIWWLLALIAVLALRLADLWRDSRLRKLPREERLRSWEYSRGAGIVVALGCILLLAWEWSRGRSAGDWSLDSPEIAMVVLAPWLFWGAVQQALGRPMDSEDWMKAWRSPVAVVLLALGFVNAYALGAWDGIPLDAVRDPFIWGVVLVYGGCVWIWEAFLIRDREAERKASIEA